jgi:hypothetical protein
MERRDESTNSWPLDARHALALVSRIARDVDDASHERRDLLLEDLMCAAWPTSTAQDQ